MLHEERNASDQGDLRPEIEALKADIRALRQDVATLVQDLVAAGKVRAGEAGEALTDAARSRLAEYGVDLDELTQRSRETMDNLSDQVQRHPLTSVGIALGLGMVLGGILHRR